MEKRLTAIFCFRQQLWAAIGAIIILLLSWCPLWGLDAAKPVDRYLVDQWDISEGIPSNQIRSIAQTPDGYLWIATAQGLLRFDGLKYSTLAFTGGAGGGTGESITPDTLFVDKEGTLWIGSAAGLTSYRYRTGRFHTYTSADGITKDRIRLIKDDMRGNLWVSFFSSYVNRFSEGKFTVFDASQGLAGKKVNAIVEDRQGNLLFGTRENGVFAYRDGLFSRYSIAGLDNVQIIVMVEDRDNELWIGTNKGLYRVVGSGTQKYTVRDGLSNDYIIYITQDSDRNLWVGTVKGLNRIRKRQNGAIDIEPLLKPFTVFCLFEDREKSLWVGTYGSGIRRLKEGKFMSYAPLEAYPEEIFFSLFEDGKGDIWTGTLNGRLFRCRGTDNGVIESIKPPGLSGTGISSIAEDAEGNLWLGTNGKGVFQKKNQTFVRFTTEHGLADNVVSSIFKDSGGNLWLSTFDGVSVIRYPGRVIESLNSRNGLLGKRVHNVYEDSNQNIWIAADKGITIITKQKLLRGFRGRFSRKEPPGVENFDYLLQDISVTCIYEDMSVSDTGAVGSRVYWVATHGAGLKRLAIEDGTVTSYTTGAGMDTNFIYQFFEDRQGNFWLMSSSGILRVSKKELNRFAFAGGSPDRVNCTSFGLSDGMKSPVFNNEFSRHSALRTRNGEFWFLTEKGISIVNPAKVYINKLPPPVVIEAVFFNEESVPLRQEGGDTGAYTFKGITDFQFHFTAPTFLSPQKIKFKYRLEGFDGEWVFLSPGSERAARYKNLAPGTYTFRVIACNAEGVWNRNGDSITFTLKPFFYQTLFFKAGLFLMFIILAAAAAFYIYKKRPFEKKIKYKGSPLNPRFVDHCIKKLKHLMEVEKVYRDADISLPLLAKKLSVSPHLLSQVINEKLGQNFSDFINFYRIEEARKIFQSPGGEQQKIAGVAFDVGFNTLAAFYSGFKKYTGMSPAQYKKNRV